MYTSAACPFRARLRRSMPFNQNKARRARPGPDQSTETPPRPEARGVCDSQHAIGYDPEAYWEGVCVCKRKRKRKKKEKKSLDENALLLHGSLLVVGRYAPKITPRYNGQTGRRLPFSPTQINSYRQARKLRCCITARRRSAAAAGLTAGHGPDLALVGQWRWVCPRA